MAMEIRDTATSAARRTYACLRSEELHAVTDQMYYWPHTDAQMDAPTAAVTTGYINQLVLVVDNDNGIDNRGIYSFRCLEPGKTHLQGTIDVQHAEIYPVSSNNGIDPKLADGSGNLLIPDTTVAAGGIYAEVDVNVDADSLYDGDVNGTLFSYTGFVNADTQTNENVHIKTHYLLRQPTNINEDASGPQIRGDKAPAITSFLGEIFILDDFYLLDFNTTQRNFLRLVDLAGVSQQWPDIFTLDVTAEPIAHGGTFSLIHLDTYGLSNPTYAQDENGLEQKDITTSALESIVFAFSTYNVDGHTPGTSLPLVLVWNRPGFIEPGATLFTMGAANQTQSINATADPSYVAA